MRVSLSMMKIYVTYFEFKICIFSSDGDINIIKLPEETVPLTKLRKNILHVGIALGIARQKLLLASVYLVQQLSKGGMDSELNTNKHLVDSHNNVIL